MDPTAAACDPNMKKRYELFKGGQEVNFYAPLLTSGLSQQSKVLPALTKVELKMVKGPLTLHCVCPAQVKGVFALHITGLNYDFKTRG